MKLFKEYQFNFSKKDDISLLFQQIKTIRERHFSSTEPIHFLFEGSTNYKIYPIVKVLQSYPEMISFAEGYDPFLEHLDRDDPRHFMRLTNWLNEETIKKNLNDIDFEILKSIITGIPRPYPFWKAFLTINVNWGQNDKWIGVAPKLTKESMSNGIVFEMKMEEQREYLLKALVELPEPNGEKILPIDPFIEKSIRIIGSVKKGKLLIIPSDEEEKVLGVKNILFNEFHNDYINYRNFDLYKEIHYPFELPDPMVVLGEFNIGSRKKAIVKHFKRRGFVHLPKETFHGHLVMGKRTEKNNFLTVHFDSGDLLCNIRCSLAIQGLMWEVPTLLELPCRKDSFSDFYPIWNEEILDKVIANYAESVDFGVRTYIKGIEDIYGASPAWMEYY